MKLILFVIVTFIIILIAIFYIVFGNNMAVKPITLNNIPPDDDTKIFTLSDGRYYAYTDSDPNRNNPNAVVVVYFHGSPGCRLDFKSLKGKDLRVIKVDRPGYGRSTTLETAFESIPEYANDLKELLSHLNIEKFIVAGTSGGSLHVLGAIHTLQEQVVAGLIFSGLSDLKARGATEGMMSLNKIASKIGGFSPKLLAYLMDRLGGRLFDPAKFLRKLESQTADSDKKAFAEKGYTKDDLINYLAESFHQGSQGHQQEILNQFGKAFPWGVDLERLKTTPLYWWHGADDKNIPAVHAKIFKEYLPHTQVKIIENEGHTSYQKKRFDEIYSVFMQHKSAFVKM